jgi:hypothetical protein
MPSGVASGSRPRFEAENGRRRHVCSFRVGYKFHTPLKLWLRGFALPNDLGADPGLLLLTRSTFSIFL